VPSTRSAPPAVFVWLGLGIVYVIWGSTYLAIRVAVETMPPLLTSGLRFCAAGLVLATIIAARSGPSRLLVGRRELVSATLVGAALVLGGNGLVMIAERDVASGLAALIIGSVPLWVVLLRTILGDRVGRGTLAGVAVGFVGVAVLVVPSGGEGTAQLVGAVLLVIASASWASGSFASARLPLPRDPFVSTAYQMASGGILVTIAGLALGETNGLDPAHFSSESLLAVGYLLVFGSLIAFTAYTWLLQNAPISLVATYAYVNPVVAVFLGWLILGEPVTAILAIGAALIVVAVAFVIRQEYRPDARATAAEPAPVPVAVAVDPEG
jgi:drug/metabolite transporter (DMT)-like permease